MSKAKAKTSTASPSKAKSAKKSKSSNAANKYKSKFELKTAAQLEGLRVVFGYETTSIPYIVPESKHIYKPDFEIGAMFVECKGLLDLESRKKMELIKTQYPHLDIRIVFQRDQPIRKGSKTMYSDWAKSLGFQYAIGSIPEEWILL